MNYGDLTVVRVDCCCKFALEVLDRSGSGIRNFQTHTQIDDDKHR